MSNRYKVTTLVLSGKEISVDNNDPNSYLSHDGTFKNPIAGLSTSGNLQNTGLALQNSINLVSGGLTITGQTLYNLISNYTGYNNTNPSGFIMSINANNEFVHLIGNETISGQKTFYNDAVFSKIVISGASSGLSIYPITSLGSDQWYTINYQNLSELKFFPNSSIDLTNNKGRVWIDTNGEIYFNNPSGKFLINPNGLFSIQGNNNLPTIWAELDTQYLLYLSGQKIRILGPLDVSGSGNFSSGLFVSGMSVSTGDLIGTGQALQSQLNTLTSNLQATGISLKITDNLISGNLIITGQTLDNKINSISGWANNMPRVSAINVTGFGNQTGIINFSGKGSVVVFTGDNNFVFISGGASGPGGGVSSLNSLDGDIVLVGVNGTTVETDGQNINISAGSSSIPSGTYIFRQYIPNGVNKQFINFPYNLTGTPIVIASLHNEVDDTILPCQISGAVPTGFWAILPNTTNNTGYMINVIATSTGTGFASNVFIENNTINNIYTGTQIRITGSSVFTGLQFTGLGSTTITTNNNIVFISGSTSSLQITGGSGINISQSGDFSLINSTVPLCIPFSTVSITLTNMTAPLAFFNSSNITSITYADLSPYSQVSVSSRVATTGTSTGWLQLKYRGNFTTTVGDYLDIDADSTKTRFDTVGVTNSGWKSLVPGAKSGVYLALTQIGGNGVGDPVFGNIYAFFR